MRRATEVRRFGDWPEQRTVATLTLAFADRHRRRFRLADDNGAALLLDLPRATLLADGDGLLLENDDFVRVCAADERVLDVEARDPEHGLRIAWHIGNRHLPVQVLPGARLRILHDHVLAQMLEGLGARVTPRSAAFDPEPGAYSVHRDHG